MNCLTKCPLFIQHQQKLVELTTKLAFIGEKKFNFKN
jgi:hypothetical protein